MSQEKVKNRIYSAFKISRRNHSFWLKFLEHSSVIRFFHKSLARGRKSSKTVITREGHRMHSKLFCVGLWCRTICVAELVAKMRRKISCRRLSEENMSQTHNMSHLLWKNCVAHGSRRKMLMCRKIRHNLRHMRRKKV